MCFQFFVCLLSIFYHIQFCYFTALLDFRNDRRSRRLFVSFYSAIFQLTCAKFHAFAYNSRTVWSSCMKFWQQFEINKLYVCTKFRGNRSCEFGFRTRKPSRKFDSKSGLIQKGLNTEKKYFTWLYASRQGFQTFLLATPFNLIKISATHHS